MKNPNKISLEYKYTHYLKERGSRWFITNLVLSLGINDMEQYRIQMHRIISHDIFQTFLLYYMPFKEQTHAMLS